MINQKKKDKERVEQVAPLTSRYK